MEERVVRFFTILILIASTLSVSMALFYPDLHSEALKFSHSDILGVHTVGHDSVMALVKSREFAESGQEDAEAEKHHLRLELPNSVKVSDINFEDFYLEKKIRLTIPGLDKNYFYDYPVLGKMKDVKDITYTNREDTGVIDIQMKKIYVCKYTESGRYLYLDFIKPKDYYDHVVVIDAGHGGEMPGASSYNGKVLEKDLNLAIVKKLKDVFDDAGDSKIGVYYTRLRDVNPDFADRVGLANALMADVFLSVHINACDRPEEAYVSGIGVMYKVSDESGKSKKFAKTCLKDLLAELNTESKRTIPGDEIYIIRNSKVPVALAEVGFITNEQELKNLRSYDYQVRMAQALHRAILEFMGVLK